MEGHVGERRKNERPKNRLGAAACLFSAFTRVRYDLGADYDVGIKGRCEDARESHSAGRTLTGAESEKGYARLISSFQA